jgi:hypothetical protein
MIARGLNDLHACHEDTRQNIDKLAERVDKIEQVPDRIFKWLLGLAVAIVVGGAGNLVSNWVLHLQTQQQVSVAASAAQTAVKVSSTESKHIEHQVDTLSANLGVATNSTAPADVR